MLLLIAIIINPSCSIKVEKIDSNRTFSPHDPIYIHGNDDFTSENGVTGGSGTSSDPYIICGWIINASSKAGMTLKNVSVFFKIWRCYIHSGGKNKDGIVFYNVTNGIIEYSTITRNRNGIIFRHLYPGNENSSNNYIHHNNITYNKKDGIHFEHLGWSYHSHNRIYRNNIKGNSQGIYMVMSAYNLIYKNDIVSNSEWGVNLTMCMGGGKYNKVYHNNFLKNGEEGRQACSQWTTGNFWDDGYPSGGNFWSDYNGSDNYSGPNQNIPGSDGIGDTPYTIPTFDWEDDNDSYPLMEPFGNWPIAPIAQFQWIPILPNPGEMILFNASESIDFDGNITLYEWDWNSDGEFDENHTNYTTTHSWAEDGYYPVTLKITDNDNGTDSITKTVRVGNLPPYEPSHPSPPDGATNVLGSSIHWTGGDPDPDDTVTYDVYFGKYNPPPLVYVNQSGTYFNTGAFEFNTTYYWQIVAWDNYNASTPGPIWSFSTLNPIPPEIEIINPKFGYFHLFGNPLFPTPFNIIADTIAIGGFKSKPIQIKAPYHNISFSVSLSINDEDQGLGTWNPKTGYYEWYWTERAFGTYIIKAMIKDPYGFGRFETIKVWCFCL